MLENSVTSTSLPIGRYFGIPLRMHFTFLIYLIVRFQQFNNNPLFGFLLVAGFALSIILHEYGHALAAKKYGGWPEEVILWQFGGLAICREPRSLIGSLATTVGGPLVTLALVGLFSGSAGMLQTMANPAMHGLVRLAQELARFNLLALVFNLIPAFPMDGGRLLRDLLAFHTGRYQATTLALTISRYLAVLALIAGLVFANVTLVVLSVFLFMATGWRSGPRF